MAESRLGTLFARHRKAVRRFVLRLVRDEALADDLTQETFVHAQRSDSRCRDRAAEQAWFYSIALNVVRDHFRARKRAPKEPHEAAWPADPPSTEALEQGVMQEEMSACILEYLDTVPSPQRELLMLHDMVGLKHVEIAEILNISEANSRVQLHRARSLFRSILENNCALSFNGDPIPCERLSEKKSS